MNPVLFAPQASTAFTAAAGVLESASIARSSADASAFVDVVSNAVAFAAQAPSNGLFRLASAAQPDPYMFDVPETQQSTPEATAGLIVIMALLAAGSLPVAITKIRSYMRRVSSTPANDARDQSSSAKANPNPELARHHMTGTSLRPPAMPEQHHGHGKRGIN